MFHLVDFTALDNFIDKIAKEQADPSLKNQDCSYSSPFLYDLALIKDWNTLGDTCLEEMKVCSRLVSDLAFKLDISEADVWYDDIIYLLGEWHKALKWRREEHNAARKIRPAKELPAKLEPQHLLDLNITPDVDVPQATLVEANAKCALKRGREEEMEVKCDIKRPRPELVTFSLTHPA